MLRLVGGGKDERASALSPYGPVRVGLTTSQRINEEVRLTELLNCLEREVETLESKSLEVYATLTSVMERLVRLGSFTFDTTTTNVVK